MKALVWHGRRDVRVETVPDPAIQEPTDAIVRVTSSGICGSDLHLYEVMGPFLEPGDVLGHEPMGTVEEVGREVRHVRPGDRVVVPFNISCGECFMCSRGLFAQCERTQVRDHGKGRRSSATRSCTARFPAGRPSTCGCRWRTSAPSRSPKAHPTNGSSTCRCCSTAIRWAPTSWRRTCSRSTKRRG